MKRFALLGENIKHTQIKRVHAELGDHEYVLIEIEKPEEMKTYFDDDRFDGFNIMHPYRNAVIAYLDELSEEAERSYTAEVSSAFRRTVDKTFKSLAVIDKMR